jgi:hypothetical protein
MITFDYIGILIVMTGEGIRKDGNSDRHCRANPHIPPHGFTTKAQRTQRTATKNGIFSPEL